MGDKWANKLIESVRTCVGYDFTRLTVLQS